MGLVNSLINYLTKLRSLRHENVMKIEGIFLSHEESMYVVNIAYEYFDESE